ncbi:MAG: GTP cyclohydrolase II, partial [Gammaproteobacteria bacterium]
MRIKTLAKAKLPTPWADFSITAFEDMTNGEEHLAITLGNLDKDPLLRIHSQCLTGDALFSLRCDCGSQLETALQKIAAEGNGLIIYMAQEGRGIGLGNKIKAY